MQFNGHCLQECFFKGTVSFKYSCALARSDLKEAVTPAGPTEEEEVKFGASFSFAPRKLLVPSIITPPYRRPHPRQPSRPPRLC